MITKIRIKLFLLIAIILVASCSDSGPPTTETTSNDPQFTRLSDKIAFLEKYVNFKRTYNDLDFAIFYRNNSSWPVAGPSDWDITLIAKIPIEEIKLWTEGLEPIPSPKIDWIKNLPGSIDRSGISTWFKSDIRLVGVDERNGIIIYQNTNMHQLN